MPAEIMEFLARFALFGMPGVVLTWVLVWGLKTFFQMPSKYVPYASLAAGMGVAGAIWAIDTFPTVEPFIMAITAGLMMGLAAMGAHSGIKAIKGFLSVAPDSPAAAAANSPGAMVAPPGSMVQMPSGVVTSDPAVAAEATKTATAKRKQSEGGA